MSNPLSQTTSPVEPGESKEVFFIEYTNYDDELQYDIFKGTESAAIELMKSHVSEQRPRAALWRAVSIASAEMQPVVFRVVE